MQKRRKNRQKSPVFDMETLIIRQISYQIADEIKAAFPGPVWTSEAFHDDYYRFHNQPGEEESGQSYAW